MFSHIKRLISREKNKYLKNTFFFFILDIKRLLREHRKQLSLSITAGLLETSTNVIIHIFFKQKCNGLQTRDVILAIVVAKCGRTHGKR